MPSPNILLYLIISLALGLANQNILAQESWDYDFYIDTKKIGGLRISYQPKQNGNYVIEQLSQIKISEFWAKADIHSTLTEQHDKNGSFIKSNHKIRENGRFHRESIQSSKRGFSVYQFESQGNTEKDNPISKNSFDTTFLNIPHLWKKYKNKLPPVLRILDTEDTFVFTAHIRRVHGTNLKISKYTNQTEQHYIFSVKDAEPINIGLAISEKGLPYFTKITGIDDGDTYRIVLLPHQKERQK